MFKLPPQIIHIGERPDAYAASEILAHALQKLRVPVAARRLMHVYCAQATGFRPSLEFLRRETGIVRKNISKYRNVLQSFGLIAYDGDAILIDWVRLKAFASIDLAETGERKNWKISPVQSPKCYESVKTCVHNYRVRDMLSNSSYCKALYEATAQAVEEGVDFPELQSADLPILPKCYEIVKTCVHNYRENDLLSKKQLDKWYDAFIDIEPAWAEEYTKDLPF